MNSIVKTLEHRVTDFLKKYGLFYNASILVAFSGGPDSTALLHILHSLAKQKKLDLQISAVYVNHNLRSEYEIQKEISFISNFSNNLQIDLHILECPKGTIEEIALQRCRGLEDAAREARYSNIFSLMDSYSYSVLATAHTLDDQIETLLMRFLQGAGPEGLLGVRETNRSIVRPLLGTGKEEIINYLNHYDLQASIDSTNLESRFLRNKIRDLIPGIKQVFPGLYRSLIHGQEKLEILFDHLKNESSGDAIDGVLQKESDSVSCYVIDFLELDRYQRTQLIYRAWELLFRENQLPIPYNTIKKLIHADEELFRNTGNKLHERPSGSKRILEFAGISIYTDSNRLFWVDNIVHTKNNKYLKVVSGIDLELFPGCTLAIKSSKDAEKDDILLVNTLNDQPIIVRSFISGDDIELDEGRKQVSKLLKDWKILSERRWMVPVIEDRMGIAAVLGKAFGGKNRIASRMKVVNIFDAK